LKLCVLGPSDVVKKEEIDVHDSECRH
jgi:hypothetical protein